MSENISSVTPIEFTGKSQKEKVKEITEKLEQGIKDLFNSDRYKEYLSAMISCIWVKVKIIFSKIMDLHTTTIAINL